MQTFCKILTTLTVSQCVSAALRLYFARVKVTCSEAADRVTAAVAVDRSEPAQRAYEPRWLRAQPAVLVLACFDPARSILRRTI
jgi:hypothetical protein